MKGCVSIVVPVYNLGQGVLKCLNSLAAQTYTKIEVIVVDDGSADDTLELCRSFAENDRRFFVYANVHSGVSATRNYGIDRATGEFLMFADGDDTVAPDMVENYFNAIAETACDVAVGGLTMIEVNGEQKQLFSEKGIFTPEELYPRILNTTSGLFGFVCNKIYSLDLLNNNKLRFDNEMIVQEDLNLALNAYMAADKIAVFDYCGYNYFRTPGKRKIPVRDIFKNLLLLLVYGDKYSTPKTEVYRRILSTLYTFIYHAEIPEMRKLHDWAEFRTALTESGKHCGSRLYASLFLNRHFRLLRAFYNARRTAAALLAKIRKRQNAG